MAFAKLHVTALLSAFLLTLPVAVASQHPSFTQFASPIPQYTISKTAVTFPTDQSTDTINVSMTDSAIYRYVNVSFNGQSWMQRSLSAGQPSSCTVHPDDPTGTWLTGTCTLTVPVTPADFSLSAPGTVRRNYVVSYSCTENIINMGIITFRLGWDCHGSTETPQMWQIHNYTATLEEQAPGPTCSDGIMNGGETGVDCGGSCDACSTSLRVSLSESQDFIVPDDAPNEEYVGVVKVYPKYERIGSAPTFELTGGEVDTYSLDSSTGLISIRDNTNLNVGVDILNITISKTGFADTTINVYIKIVDSENCTFVDSSETTNGLGTRASPRNTISEYESGANKIYLFKRGTTYNTRGYNGQGHDNITFASYGIGAMPKLANSGTGARVLQQGRGADNFIVRDLEITTENPASDGSNWVLGIYGYSYGGGWSNILIDHCNVHHSGISLITNPPDPLANNATVIWTTIEDIRGDGIFVKNVHSKTVLNNNYINRVNLDYIFVGTAESQSPGDGIQADNTEELFIQHNYIDRSYTGNKFCIIVGTPQSFENEQSYTIIENNYLVPPANTGVHIYQYFEDGEVNRNYFSGGVFGVYDGTPNSEVEFDYNIFDSVGTAIRNNKAIARNNIFYGCTSAFSQEAILARNNIFYFTNEGQSAYFSTGLGDSDYNLFNREQSGMFGGSGGGTLSAVVGEKNSIVGNPLFVDPASGTFHLQEGSPAIDAGVLIPGINDDYEGTAPDIGAFEYQGE